MIKLAIFPFALAKAALSGDNFYKVSEKKRKESEKLREVVNEVKKLEADLDRANAQCSELTNEILFEEKQQKVNFTH
ncbi:unnamed protein product [Gongylonema pulchrum]|uniref:Myosin_tail_1 domain-containing protein n=1 Tax=Gongylonema pulchrum TaxID=637853 RepID=A0A183EUR7_9BILA|nr:unnamed protein product [Gongylonema pulchrum]